MVTFPFLDFSLAFLGFILGIVTFNFRGLYLGPKLRPGVDFGVIRYSSTSSIT